MKIDLSQLRSLNPESLRSSRTQATAIKEHLIRQGGWQGAVAAHVDYQDKPVEWIVEKLGIPENTIRWSINEGYRHCSCTGPICFGGGEHKWDGDKDPQVLALEAMARDENVAVSSGTGTGKSHTIGAAGTLWYLACFADSIVLSIAPKSGQLLKNMWKEMGKLFPPFKRMFPHAEMLTGVLRMKEGAEDREVWAASAFSAGKGADEEIAQRLAGFHNPRMLWIIEDAPGVDVALLNTILNTSVGRHNIILALGNPDSKFDTLGLFTAKDWVTSIRISALDHPNVVLDEDLVPGAVSRVSIARRESDYGLDDEIKYKSRVRGITPEQSLHSLIRREWCQAALEKYNDPRYRVGVLSLGVDPSNSDHHGLCAIARWQGACLTEVEERVCPDAMVLGEEVWLECQELGISPFNVGVDSIGVGSNTVNKCKEHNFYVRGLNGASKPELRIDEDVRYQPMDEDAEPDNPQGPIVVPEERYRNLRAQMWWRMRQDLRLGRIALPNDPILFDQLCIVQWEPKAGKIVIQKKEEIIEKLGRSPDRADAAIYGNFVRTRRPLPAPEEELPSSKHFDNRFKEMMGELAVATSPDYISRRPF